MKTRILILAMASAVALFAAEAPKPAIDVVDHSKIAAPAVDPVAAVTKERDDLKTQLATAQQQTGALQEANRNLQIIAERNEALIRLIQANANIAELQKQLDTEKAKTAELEKKLAASTEPPKK